MWRSMLQRIHSTPACRKGSIAASTNWLARHCLGALPAAVLLLAACAACVSSIWAMWLYLLLFAGLLQLALLLASTPCCKQTALLCQAEKKLLN